MLQKIMNAFGYVKAGTGSRFVVSDYSTGAKLFGQSTQQNYKEYLQKYADISWVYSCIYTIANKAAGIGTKLYRKTNIKGKKILEEIDDHPVLDLLEKANPIMSGYDLKESTFSFLELTGNAYWLLDRLTGNIPSEIYPLNPHRIKIVPDAKTYVNKYIYDVGQGKTIDYAKEEIIHFKYFNPLDDFYGLSPISAARLSIDTINFSDEYNRNFFINSAQPGGIIEVPTTLPDKIFNRLKESWDSLHRGYKKAHRPTILEGGAKWVNSGLSQKDMEFIQSKKMTREDILGVFGVPPSLVGIFEYANYANSREQTQIFWLNTEVPKITKYYNVINSFLVMRYGDDLVAGPDLSTVEALQKDKKLLAEVNEILLRNGVITINEVREEMKKDKVSWGESAWLPMNLLPVSSPREEEPKEEEEEGKGINNYVSKSLERTGVRIKESENGIKKVLKSYIKKDDEEETKAREIREKIWNHFKTFTEQWERKFKPILRSFFTKQEREVINNLRESGWKDITGNIQIVREKEICKAKIDVIIFDKKEADKILKKNGKPIISGVLENKANIEIDRYGLGYDFDMSNPVVARWIEARSSVYAEECNETTREELRKELKESLELGESIDEAEKRIERVYGMARGYRTERIARTEIISASNKGALESYEQSGVVEKKTWISSRDANVRESHQIDGESIGLDGTFSNGLEYPGDPSGGAEEVCNCRCTLGAIIER